MNIDPLQILQVTLYSKITNAFFESGSLNSINITFLSIAYCIYKILNNQYIRELIDDFLYNSTYNTECLITIPYHKRNLTQHSFGVQKENIHITYSNRFHALNYYLQKHAPENISQMVEILKREYKNAYYDSEVIDFVLLPVQNQKIEICKKRGILFEIIVEQEQSEDDGDDKKKKKKPNLNAKNYIYRISKQGRDNYHILKQFLDECVTEFENETINKTQQQIFEFIKTENDEEDNIKLSYRASDFHSNKHLDKNIFFEDKQNFINYIDKFKNTNSNAKEQNPSVHEFEYEDTGVTFKAGILLHGEPGCGKSCTIRGILNRTKRHGVLVRWSLIKTCSDFVGIFRSAINNKKYNLRELCFIFEDFDANKDEVLKKRTDIINKLNIDISTDDSDDGEDIEPPTSIEDIMKKTNDQQLKTVQNMLQTMTKNNTDELTLECVLNTIDGIVELHNAMYIFTTNMDIRKLDGAFIRPGRIDYILELKRATVNTIREMVSYRYRNDVDMKKYDSYFKKMKDGKITPAEVQNVYFKYEHTKIRDCLQELVSLTNSAKN
jgi:SpoVK/Ycf46/Vps4 family AAA+-type ATPase